VDEAMMAMIRSGDLESYCGTARITSTAGTIDPTQPLGATRLGSNVWGEKTLAGGEAPLTRGVAGGE